MSASSEYSKTSGSERSSASVDAAEVERAKREIQGLVHEIAELSHAFGYDVDFQRDVGPRDHFELVFERYVDGAGATVRPGPMLFIALDTRQGPKRFHAFQVSGLRG